MTEPTVAITELEEFEPTRVDGVGKGANGFPILMMKATGDSVIDSEHVVTEIEAAQLAQADAEAKIDAALKAGTKECPTCKGSGKIKGNTTKCPDCQGDGKVASDFGKARSTADTNDLPDSAFAYIEPGGSKDSDGRTTPRSKRHFPIDDAAHVRNALARVDSSPFGEKALPAIKKAAEKFGVEVSKDLVTGVNAEIIDPSDPANIPGSPVWEQADADAMTDAATQLVQAANKIKAFIGRERTEADAGEVSDWNDVYDAQEALQALSFATGIAARLALQEAAEATKDVAEKSGKRLSTKSVSALAAARDHLNTLLGDDDPAKSKEDDASKQQGEDILDMTKDELIKLLDERDEARRVAKKESKAEKQAAKAARAEGDEIETETPSDEDAAKAEAETADETSEEDLAKKVADLEALVEEMGKRAAPGGPVKTRTKEQITKAAERDTLIQEAEVLERRADNTLEADVRKGYLERAKALRARAEAA